jgi:hypothetical protein
MRLRRAHPEARGNAPGVRRRLLFERPAFLTTLYYVACNKVIRLYFNQTRFFLRANRQSVITTVGKTANRFGINGGCNLPAQ